MKALKKVIATVAVGAMLAVPARAEEERAVSFPYGLTGFETLQECSEVMSERFGEGEFTETEDSFSYIIRRPEEKLYEMSIDYILCNENKDDNDESIDNVIIRLYDDTSLDAYSRLLDLFLFAQTNYGRKLASVPVKNQTDF